MADKDKGFIALFRSIQENELWEMDEPFDRRSAFVDLIMMANFEEKTFVLHGSTKTTIKRGQLHTSIGKLAKRWKWSENKVRRFLALLKELDMVHSNGTPYGTTLTLVNYGKYQLSQRTYGSTNERPDERADERTDERTNGRRLNNNKQLNNDKKGKKIEGASLPFLVPEWVKEKYPVRKRESFENGYYGFEDENWEWQIIPTEGWEPNE